MMAGLLRGVGEATLSAAIMILAVWMLRLRFQDRTPRRVFCLLWDMVLVRLLALGSLISPVSIRRWLPEMGTGSAAVSQEPAAVSVVREALVVGEAATAQVDGITYLAEDAAWEFSGTAQTPLTPDWGAVLTALWLAAALLLAGSFLWSHLRSRRVYAASLPCRDSAVLDWLAARPLRRPVQARISDRIAAPLTYGVLYPVILLPRGMDGGDTLSCVLAHEHTHIRRFDALRKAFLATALCLHWFNPLVWVMYALANRDMELACDEAVLRSGADREQYALALLGMEERRGQWSPSGSHFSGHALEERIKAIMKRKHISIAALAAVLVVMSITTTVFASAAPEGGAEPKQEQSGLTAGYVTPLEEDGVMMMSKGPDGEKQYSVDGGETWMSKERYQAEYGSWGDDWQVEWWTYEDYKAWLEQEKKDLQEVIGSRGWTPSTGWFTWDQKMVDETVAMYEGILEDIKNGALYSRTIIDKDGNEIEDVALGSDGPLNAVVTSTFDEKDMVSVAPKSVDKAALLEELKAFGIGGNENLMTYNGQLIRHFVDGAPVGSGEYSVQYVYTNPDGTVDVHTLRSVIHNPDGSYDTMGDLIGVAAKGDKNFDQELVDAAVFAGGAEVTTDDSFEPGQDQNSAVPTTGTQTATAEGSSGWGGTSFEEIFAPYEEYGLIYQPREGDKGALTFNGLSVRSFADLKPDGGVFSYEDPYLQEGLTVRTEYDRDGRLTGLAADPAPQKDIDRDERMLGFDYSAPVQGSVSAGFGQGKLGFHYGVDIAAEKGADVTAFADGVVSEAGFSAEKGNYILLSHADGYTTLYAHCGSAAVSQGDSVAMGEKIAEVGASGMATGPVLHFELRSGSTYLDPEPYLTAAV